MISPDNARHNAKDNGQADFNSQASSHIGTRPPLVLHQTFIVYIANIDLSNTSQTVELNFQVFNSSFFLFFSFVLFLSLQEEQYR